MMLTGSFANIVTLRGIQEVIGLTWEERKPVGREIFNTTQSSQYREHTVTVGGVGVMDTKSQGEAINYDDMNEGFLTTYTHVTYAKGLRASYEMLADEMYGILNDLGVELAMSADATEETVLSNHFNNGFSGSFTGYDSVALFSAAHVRENGVTYSNTSLSGTSAVSVDLSQAALEQGMIDFRTNFRTGGSRRLRIKPRYLLVAPDNQMNAARLLDSKFEPGSDVNAVNPVSSLGLELVVWDYLTDVDSWFILAEKENHKLKLYDRQPFTSEYIYDFDTKDYKISGLFRQSSGWGDARGLYGVQGA